jgi:hypothetical protein
VIWKPASEMALPLPAMSRPSLLHKLTFNHQGMTTLSNTCNSLHPLLPNDEMLFVEDPDGLPAAATATTGAVIGRSAGTLALAPDAHPDGPTANAHELQPIYVAHP